MTKNATKLSLSPLRQRLLELMQDINFGRIEGLVVRSGEPRLDPPPRAVRKIKFGSTNGCRPQTRGQDFALKSQVQELFAYLDEMGDGTIEVLEIQHGLPFRMTVAEVVAA